MTNGTCSLPERLTFETAAAHACTQVPIAAPATRAGDLRQALMGQRYESATHIVICEAGTFRGILPLEDLLAAPAEAAVSTLMDAEGRFVGLIPPHRLLAVLLSEHEEDLSRLGGFLKNTSIARHASEEAILRRFWHRLPLLCGARPHASLP